MHQRDIAMRYRSARGTVQKAHRVHIHVDARAAVRRRLLQPAAQQRLHGDVAPRLQQQAVAIGPA
jgi:hypothetical protein